jgi:Type II secretory pathway, pseudopilin PulG
MYRTRRADRKAYAILEGMKGGLKAHGFTIVETLAVLAISAGLFVAVAATLSGRQGRTEFSQSMQDVRSQIQQVINDVGTGSFPDTNNFRCAVGGTGPNITNGTSNQGGNTGCVFLGKAIQFDINGTSDPEELRVYTIAGLQRDSSGAEITTYANAKPTVIAPTSGSPGRPDSSSRGVLRYGLTLKEAYYGATKTNIGSIAFVSTLSGGPLVSSSQHINVIPIKNSTTNATAAVGAQAIETNLATSDQNPSTGIKLCFVSGGSKQSGLITIGGNDRQLSVDLKISENTTCA